MPLYEGIGLINEKLPVVLEIGQALTKAGFAGENSSRCIVPSAVRVRAPNLPETWNYLYDLRDENELYQALVEFLHNLYFKHLLVTPKERKVVLIESIFTPTRWRQVLAKVLFLHYEVQNILFIPTQMGGVTATGTDTALLLDIGKEDALVIPFVSGVTLLNHISNHELGAKAFDKNLKQLLMSNCLNTPQDVLTDLLDPITVEDIRLRTCLVTSIDRAERLEKDLEPSPALPSFHIEMRGDLFVEFSGTVRERAGEIWFQNQDLDGISIPQMVLTTISKCPIDTRHILAKSILLCGGASCLPGFKARLIRELKRLSLQPPFNTTFNESYEFRLFDPPCPQNVVSWFGGAVYGSSEAMGLRGISKEFYLKHGNLPDWSDCTFVNFDLGVGSLNPTPNSSPIFSIKSV